LKGGARGGISEPLHHETQKTDEQKGAKIAKNAKVANVSSLCGLCELLFIGFFFVVPTEHLQFKNSRPL